MVNKKLSINDIAKHLNISKSTVSLVINGKASERRISKDLQKKVLDYVKEVGFQPHHLAQSLATGRSNSIGLVVENISDSFFGPIAMMIENLAKNHGFRVMYSSTLGDPQTAKEIINFFRRSQLDGYILAPTIGIDKIVQEMVAEKIPVVLFDRDPIAGVHFVGTNNKEATIEACTHIFKQGFRNIGFVTLDSSQSQMSDRLNGYKIAAHNFKIKPVITHISFEKEKNLKKKQIQTFLEKNKTLDAVIFSTNYLCMIGLEVINELNKKIPKDLAVVSFDDHEAFNLVSPSITAIQQPLEELSKHIIELLIRQIQYPTETATSHIILASKLKIRKSSEK